MANGYVHDMYPLLNYSFQRRTLVSNHHHDFHRTTLPLSSPPRTRRSTFSPRHSMSKVSISASASPRTFLRIPTMSLSHTSLRTSYRRTLHKQNMIPRARTHSILTLHLVLNRWSILIGLAVVVLASLGAYFFSPKGENNT